MSLNENIIIAYVLKTLLLSLLSSWCKLNVSKIALKKIFIVFRRKIGNVISLPLYYVQVRGKTILVMKGM